MRGALWGWMRVRASQVVFHSSRSVLRVFRCWDSRPQPTLAGQYSRCNVHPPTPDSHPLQGLFLGGTGPGLGGSSLGGQQGASAAPDPHTGLRAALISMAALLVRSALSSQACRCRADCVVVSVRACLAAGTMPVPAC